MQVFVLLSCVGVILALEDEQQYCGPRYTHLCLGKGQHVACQFPVAGSGPNCQNYSRIRFTNQVRIYITNFINKRRQRIAAGHERVRGGKLIPQPQIMMFVEWDFELARLAQRLADQCYFVHDECRATVRYPYAGQAVGEVRWKHLSNSYELSAQRGIRRVFDAWWGERRRVEPQQLVQPFRITDKGLVWGHFSQIAVWTLRAVGCGAVRHGEDYPRLLLVCDFSHTNMLGEKTLNPGEAAPCPEHTRRKARSNFPLLCASEWITSRAVYPRGFRKCRAEQCIYCTRPNYISWTIPEGLPGTINGHSSLHRLADHSGTPSILNAGVAMVMKACYYRRRSGVVGEALLLAMTLRIFPVSYAFLQKIVKEQIKHSRVVEDDTLDESDYDDVDDDESHVRDDLKKIAAEMPKPRKEEEDWRNSKKPQPPEETYPIEETTVKKWTTSVYVTDFNEEDEYATTTRITKVTKAPKRLKIKMQFSRPTTTEGNISDEEEHGVNLIDRYQKAEEKVSNAGYYHGYYDLKERLPADLRVDRSDEIEDQQETLILTVTPSPFVLKNNVKQKKQERPANKIVTTSTVASAKIIHNAHLQNNPRQRWKPERDRDRHERPGAAALLRHNQSHSPMDRLEPVIPPRISFQMDEDDAEQLHADTGFKKSWKNDTIPV